MAAIIILPNTMPGRILVITDGPASLTHTPVLLNLLKKDKFSVKVAPTGYAGASALAFTTELSWSLLSGHPCLDVARLDQKDFSAADAIVLYPVSPAVLEIFSRGKALEMLQNSRRPVIVCPALADSLKSNENPVPDISWFAELNPRSTLVLPSADASPSDSSQLLGNVHIATPEAILETIHSALSKQLLMGKKVLITAGPTLEDFDPVRFISNRSSGKMGIALALEACRQGAKVQLVHGPIHLQIPSVPSLELISVRSAAQMYNAVMEHYPSNDIAILCAAVADFTPRQYTMQKIKKQGNDGLIMELGRTKDILAELGALPPQNRPFLVGFAAESNDVAQNAAAKLYRKHCDMLCSNDITAPGCGFAVETNQVVIYKSDGSCIPLPLMSKQETAACIIRQISESCAGMQNS